MAARGISKIGGNCPGGKRIAGGNDGRGVRREFVPTGTRERLARPRPPV